MFHNPLLLCCRFLRKPGEGSSGESLMAPGTPELCQNIPAGARSSRAATVPLVLCLREGKAIISLYSPCPCPILSLTPCSNPRAGTLTLRAIQPPAGGSRDSPAVGGSGPVSHLVPAFKSHLSHPLLGLSVPCPHPQATLIMGAVQFTTEQHPE